MNKSNPKRKVGAPKRAGKLYRCPIRIVADSEQECDRIYDTMMRNSTTDSRGALLADAAAKTKG